MEKFCPNCGTPLKEGARFCGGCGAKRPDGLGQPAQQTQPQYTPQTPAQQQPPPPVQPPPPTQPQTPAQQQPPPPVQPQYAPPIPEPEQKKKGKAPFFAVGGAVIAVALAVTLIFTNVFGLLDQTGGGTGQFGDVTDNGNGSVTDEGGNGDDYYYYFDWETIEMFGGVEGFAEWLRYGLELDAADYYETVNGVYFMSPVEVDGIERGWLDGYPAAKD